MSQWLEVSSLSRHYPLKKKSFWEKTRFFKAVDDVSFSIKKGETLGLVGESGCGKSTLGKAVLRLIKLTSGDVKFKGASLFSLSAEEMRRQRRFMQMIFQDPYSSLNPRMTILETLEEPFVVHKIGTKEERKKIIFDLLDRVRLPRASLAKYPADFSGGQRQRIAIARALCLRPEFVVADEPVSALDVTTQAGILDLFDSFRKEFGFSCLFISHDLAVVEQVSDKVAVMFLGKIVEYGTREEVFSHPKHPYTRALLESVPKPVFKEKKERVKKLSPTLEENERPPGSCVFYGRCPLRTKVCLELEPVLKNAPQCQNEHKVACHEVY